MADVAAIFQSKPALKITQLKLYIRPEGDTIPADLLGPSHFVYSSIWGNYSGFLYIIGNSGDLMPWIAVDSNAFRSTEQQNSSLFKFYAKYLDTSRLDLQFLVM